MLRYAPGHNPNGAQDDIAGVCNAAGNVLGLMPHPEHAVIRIYPPTAAGCSSCSPWRRWRERVGVAPHRELGLTDAEYDAICDRMGREPNLLELAVFSLMWSEHCAYKHSKKPLRELPVEGPHLLMGPGENAGVVDVGTAWRWRSRSSRTTTRAPSSRSRGRPPESAASCATSSRWAPA